MAPWDPLGWKTQCGTDHTASQLPTRGRAHLWLLTCLCRLSSWPFGITASTCTITMHGFLVGWSQQPPVDLEFFSTHSWWPCCQSLRAATTETLHFYHQWGIQGSSEHQGQGGWGTASGDQGPMPNQTTFSLSATFSIFLLWPILFPTYLQVPIILYRWD
jgi:hypothetical protein